MFEEREFGCPEIENDVTTINSISWYCFIKVIY